MTNSQIQSPFKGTIQAIGRQIKITSIDGIIFEGTLPDTNEQVIIDSRNGIMYYPESGKFETYFEFRKQGYPLQTYQGIKAGLLAELPLTDGTVKLPDANQVRQNIGEFRSNIGQLSFLDRLGLNRKLLMKTQIWGDIDGRFHYAYTSQIGEPVCVYSWYVDPGMCPAYQPVMEVTGSPRLIQGSQRKIFFVEDPLQAEILRIQENVDVYVRPTTQTAEYNDYQKLIAGKHVVCLISDKVNGSFWSKPKRVSLADNRVEELLKVYGQQSPAENWHYQIDDVISNYRERVTQNMSMDWRSNS